MKTKHGSEKWWTRVSTRTVRVPNFGQLRAPAGLCSLSLSLNSQDVPSWQQRCVLCGTCLPSCEHDGFQMRGSCRFVGDAMWGQGDGTQPNAEKKNAHGQKGELPFGLVDVDGRRASLAFHLPRVSMIRSPVQSHKLLRN